MNQRIGKRSTKARDVLGHSITPALTKPTRFESLQTPPSSTAGHPVGHTVSELVDDDIVLHRSISRDIGQGPDEHTALTGLAAAKRLISIRVQEKKFDKDVLRRGREIGIIRATGILDRNLNPIPRLSTLPVIVLLEVESIFREPIPISDIMHRVDDIERIRHRAFDVFRVSRTLGVIVLGIEVESSGGFFDDGLALESDDVVA